MWLPKAINDLLTTKGDLIARNATRAIRLDVGNDDEVLTADSTEASGLKWATVGGGSALTTLIEEITLGADTTTVEFDSISGSHEELRLEIIGRSTRAGSQQDGALIRFGNTTIDSGTNYDSIGTSTAASPIESVGGTSGKLTRFDLPGASSSSGVMAYITVHIGQYSNTSIHKTYWASGGFMDGSNDRFGQGLGTWHSTSAIDIIHLLCENGDWASGSVFRLYGID